MESIFPLNDSQFDYITCEETSYIVAYKILYDVVNQIFKEKVIRDSAVIVGNHYNYLISQTNFIIKKDINEAIEFSRKVSCNRQKPPQKFRKETYSRKRNLMNYVRRTPLNFIVIGYPDENLIRIGRNLAKKLKYIHVHPNKIVNKEIYNRTPIGLWIYENLKNGKKIPMDVIELLFNKEMCREVYKDHGYVISGFPIIPNYAADETLLPESASNFNITESIDDFPLKIKNHNSRYESDDEDVNSESSRQSSDEDESEEDSECEMPDAIPNKKFSTNENLSEEELDEEEFYFSGMEDCDDLEYPEAMDETIYSFAKNSRFKNPNDSYEALKCNFKQQINSIKNLFREPTILIYVTNDEIIEQNITHEIDEENKALLNLQNVLKIIDEFIGSFIKEFVWVFDSRLRPELICNYLDNRLEYLLRKEYYVPEVIFPKCNIPKYFAKYFTNDPYHNYEVLKKTNCVTPKFSWFQHTKSYYCPVKSSMGKLVIGKIEYSVRFLGIIFVCSTFNAMQKFIKHPEKYIIYHPNCRIAILAPAKFGKSITSYFFKEYFGADHFNCKEIALKIGTVNNDIYSEAFNFAMNEANIISNIRTQYYEKFKEDKIEEFINIPLTILTDIINNVNKLINFDDGDFCNFEYAKQVLNDNNLLMLVLPSECFETNSIEMTFTNPVTQLLFEEKLNDISYRDLVLNKDISDYFIKWLLVNKHKKNKENNKRYCQWILDGPPVDLKFWKALARRNALPDVVMLPQNITLEKLEKVYSTYYNVRFKRTHDTIIEIKKRNPEFSLFEWQTIERYLIYCKNRKNDAYIRNWGKFIAAAKYERLLEYYFKLDLLKEFLITRKIIIIEVDYAEQELNKIILRIFSEYFTHTKPKILTRKDIQNMFTKQYILDPNKDMDFNSEESSLQEESADEEDEEFMDECEDDDSDVNNEKDKLIISELNLCNTGTYCPVCVIDHKFMLKGLLKYCCSYQNHIFLFSSKLCLNKFILSPEYYFMDVEPPASPSAKLCILGPNYISKMHLAHRLANKFNIPLNSSNFFTEDSKIEFFFGENDSSCHISLDSLPKELGKSYLDGLMTRDFQENDIYEKMAKLNFIPETAFIVEDYKTTLEALKIFFFNKYVQNKDVNYSSKYLSLDSVDSQNSEKMRVYIHDKCKLITEAYAARVKVFVKKLKKLNIPIIRIGQDFNLDNPAFDKMCDRVNNNRERTAIFDTVHVISMKTAEALINRGAYLISRFRKSCPVQISELNCLCNYEGMRKQDKIFPCIYRHRIFFISGITGLNLFLRNPRKYVETCNPLQLSMPIKILIMGPPKSGISSLCRRIAKEYGMKIFSENDIKQFILTEMKETRVYKEMTNQYKLTPYVFSRCLQIITSSSSAGIILDNFPVTSNLLLETAKFSVDIQITFLIQMKFKQCCEILKRKCPNHGLSEIAQDYENYYKTVEAFNFNKDLNFFHIKKIYATKNQWETWDIIKDSLLKTARTLVAYELQTKQDRSSSVYRLNVFYDELFDKLDDPPLLCPVCLKDGNQIAYRYDWNNVGERFYTRECQLELTKPNGYRKKWLYDVYRFPKPYDFNDNVKPLIIDSFFNQNLMQLKNKIYWTCDDHKIEFILNRTKYIPISENIKPIYIPLLVLNYPRLFVAYDGYCIVSYDISSKLNKEHHINVIEYLSRSSQSDIQTPNAQLLAHPNRYIEGNRDLAVYYRGKVFLFANKSNCSKFLANPQYFYELKFEPPEDDDGEDDEANIKLNFGPLKPEIIIKGLIALNKLRPKHYALTAEQSAATYLGLYLKTYVAGLKSNKLLFYKNLIELFIKECNSVTQLVRLYKIESNPFIIRKPNQFEYANFMEEPNNSDIDSLINKFKCTCNDSDLSSECENCKI